MEATITERLMNFLKFKSLTKKIFAETIGVSETQMTYWTKGERKWSDVSDLELVIASYPEISRDWLYGGVGAMRKSNHLFNEVNDTTAGYGYIPRKAYDEMVAKWNEDRESKKRLEHHIEFLEKLLMPDEKKNAC